MPLTKLATAYYNDTEQNIYLLQGNAVRDAEWAPVNDKPHAKVSVAAQSRSDGTTTFITVNGWRGRAAQVAAVRKMDSVLAVGVLKEREYKGNLYYDLDADFIAISGAGLGGGAHQPAPGRASPPLPAEADTEIDDGELPF